MCGSSLVLAAPGLESRGADSSLWIAESVRFATKLKLSSWRREDECFEGEGGG